MKYFCCGERRREAVKLHGSLNGLEYLEVRDSGIPGDSTRQLTLFVKFLRTVPATLTQDNFLIEGGDRIRTVAIQWAHTANALPAGEPASLIEGLTPPDLFMVIRTKYYGDFSIYTLRLVSGKGSEAPSAGFDPLLCEIQFSFKVQCDPDFDCAQNASCPKLPIVNPRLDYLAKDYASFRRLMLDRLSGLIPDWRSSNAADIGVMLVELLAYVGDQLSYRQDAVATEAYLGTARKRVSLRRHARLVDYAVHEGCNARVWARVFVNDDGVLIPAHTQLLTRAQDFPERIGPASDAWQEALARGAMVFETVEDALLYKSHERFRFYTWGEEQCCLPKGATAATLWGKHPKLKAGDVLVFAEICNPRTGRVEDADQTHRQAVRLTHVQPTEDPAGGLFLEKPNDGPVEVTEIRWAEEDALAFPLCLSSLTDKDKDHVATYLDTVSVAYGNIVLADHGRTVVDEDLGAVTDSRLKYAPTAADLACKRLPLQDVPPRYRPRLRERPLTQYLPLVMDPLVEMDATTAIVSALTANNFSSDLKSALAASGLMFRAGPVAVQGGDGLWSASDGVAAYRMKLDSVAGRVRVYPLADAAALITAAAPRRARPAITLTGTYKSQKSPWLPRRDLLGSTAEANEFVVESEHDGSAYLRFGDDIHGKRPNVDTSFTATYRIGNGTAGNIGAESLAHIVSEDARLLRVDNPLPAQGGSDPESAEDIKRDAPEAFRKQERAVTPADYAAVTERHSSVQRAAATFRWTGSWHTVFLTLDRKGGGEVDAAYEQTIRDHVERYRMAGYDLEVDGPVYVPLMLAMTVCVKPDYFRADVRAALKRVFSNRWLPDGRPALFHPDNFSFGQPVYLSKLYEAAQGIEGVASAVIDTFQRLRAPDPKPLAEGVLTLGRLEVARLDNDPNFPERGVLKLSMGGGK